MNKFIRIYRVFPALTSDNELSNNKNDTYLLGRHKIQVYRWNEDTLCIMFQSNQTANNIIPLAKEKGIKFELFIQGNTESIYKFKENDIHKLHEIVKFQTKGKNTKPNSVKNIRRLTEK